MSGGDLDWSLRRAVGLYADAPAIVDGDRTVSYGELEARIGKLGAGLEMLGVAEGARVGFLGANSLAHIECVMGVPIFGRVLVDLNFRLAEAELAFIASDCELEVLVVDREQLDVARALLGRCPALRRLVLDGGGDSPADCISYETLIDRDPAVPPQLEEHQLAAISYT